MIHRPKVSCILEQRSLKRSKIETVCLNWMLNLWLSCREFYGVSTDCGRFMIEILVVICRFLGRQYDDLRWIEVYEYTRKAYILKQCYGGGAVSRYRFSIQASRMELKKLLYLRTGQYIVKKWFENIYCCNSSVNIIQNNTRPLRMFLLIKYQDCR